MAWVKAGLGVAVAGASVAAVYSAADDAVLFHICSRKALQLAAADARVSAAMGSPLRVGPWYNASIGISRQGYCVSSSFPINGPNASASIHLRAFRTSGPRSTLYYNVLGGGEWHFLSLKASVYATDGKGDVIDIATMAATQGQSSNHIPTITRQAMPKSQADVKCLPCEATDSK